MSLYSTRSINLHITMALQLFFLCAVLPWSDKSLHKTESKSEYVLPFYTLESPAVDICFNLNNCLFSCFWVGTGCCMLVCGYNHYHVLVLCHCVNCINVMFRCIIDEIQALPYRQLGRCKNWWSDGSWYLIYKCLFDGSFSDPQSVFYRYQVVWSN